jgi:hypothetical protein
MLPRTRALAQGKQQEIAESEKVRKRLQERVKRYAFATVHASA